MLENGRIFAELRIDFPRFDAGEARKIRCPTLILNRERSPLWLRRIADLLGKSIADAQTAIIKGAAHLPHTEKPEESNRKVLDFIAGSRRAA